MMPFWPGQTDVACLLSSLLSLLLFDAWLMTKRRGRLIGAIVAFIAALLIKEHAVVVPLLAAAIAIHRGRPFKFVAAVGGAGLGVSALFLVVRGLVMPHTWRPNFRGPEYMAFSFVFYLCESAVLAIKDGQAWIIVSSALVAVCIAFALWRPRAVLIWGLGALVGLFLPPQLMAGNAALPTVSLFAWFVARILAFMVALVIAWEARSRAPTLVLLACVPIVHLPVLHLVGAHYYYWPVAWWSMFAAGILVSLPGTLKAAAERARKDGAAPAPSPVRAA
jgi:hypothetical protein